jgi:hypothetical protein
MFADGVPLSLHHVKDWFGVGHPEIIPRDGHRPAAKAPTPPTRGGQRAAGPAETGGCGRAGCGRAESGGTGTRRDRRLRGRAGIGGWPGTSRGPKAPSNSLPLRPGANGSRAGPIRPTLPRIAQSWGVFPGRSLGARGAASAGGARGRVSRGRAGAASAGCARGRHPAPRHPRRERGNGRQTSPRAQK